LLLYSRLEIFVQSSGGFRKAISSSHAASENLFIAPAALEKQINNIVRGFWEIFENS
jgi:hypothetical protein